MKPLSPSNNSTTSTIHKERHIVTWSQQEDDILRDQIAIHGTENWTIIAAQFKDKTTRQCRRRWYTYLNSDFKKGGWTQEEDIILCEAQKIYGNRWTEIAKVVSGRTDNAVKNRFSTLCKKRAKHEALAKENIHVLCTNQSNKRAVTQNAIINNATSESVPPLKRMRTHMMDITQNCNLEERLHIKSGTSDNQPLRPPFAVLAQNSHNVNHFSAQQNFNNTRMASNDGNSKAQETFLRRDDPRITALMQQEELLSSLAIKRNAENKQGHENDRKALQIFRKRNDEKELVRCQISESGHSIKDLTNLVEKNGNTENLLCWRQPNVYESPGSSGYSTGSNLHPRTEDEKNEAEKAEHPEAEKCSQQQGASVGKQPTMYVENDGAGCQDGFINSSIVRVGPQSVHSEAASGSSVGRDWVDCFHNGATDGQDVVSVPSCDEYKEIANTEFTSPVQETPLFKTCAAAIPSPQFSESERHFLMKTLLGSPNSNPCQNPSQPPPPCRRALLHSL